MEIKNNIPTKLVFILENWIRILYTSDLNYNRLRVPKNMCIFDQNKWIMRSFTEHPPIIALSKKIDVRNKT